MRALICDGQQAIGGRLVMWLHQSWRKHVGTCIHQAPNDPHDHNVRCMHTDVISLCAPTLVPLWARRFRHLMRQPCDLGNHN